MKRFCIKTKEDKFVCIDDCCNLNYSAFFGRYMYHVRTYFEANQFIYIEQKQKEWHVCEFEVPEVIDSKGE